MSFRSRFQFWYDLRDSLSQVRWLYQRAEYAIGAVVGFFIVVVCLIIAFVRV